MNFNADKCKIIHFGSRNEGHNYFIEGSILQATNEEKDLGVTVDNTLKFSKQCAEAVKKANKMLGYMTRNFEYKSKNVILPLYKSLVRPHLEYAVQLWSPFLEKDIAKIERIQKRATKIIPELRGKPYAQRLKDLYIHSLETRRLRGRLIEVFKILNKFDNVDYKKFFQNDSNNITRSNGQKLRKLHNHPSETNIAKNFFTNEVVGKWNGLPREIVNSTSIDSFKKKLRQTLKECTQSIYYSLT